MEITSHLDNLGASGTVASLVVLVIDQIHLRHPDLPKISTANTRFGISGGQTVVISPDDLDIVYQCFASRKDYNRVKSFATAVTVETLCGFVKHIDFIDDFSTVVFERVIPLNTMFPIETLEAMKPYLEIHGSVIKSQIEVALRELSKLGYGHGDARLDNIGITKHGCYVLFDYGNSTTHERLAEDLNQLKESFKFRGYSP